MHGRPQHSSWHTVDTLPVTTVIIYLASGSQWDLVLAYLRPLYTPLTPLQAVATLHPLQLCYLLSPLKQAQHTLPFLAYPLSPS